MSTFCHNCGNKLQSIANFCPKCGTDLKKLNPAPSSIKASNQEELIETDIDSIVNSKNIKITIEGLRKEKPITVGDVLATASQGKPDDFVLDRPPDNSPNPRSKEFWKVLTKECEKSREKSEEVGVVTEES